MAVPAETLLSTARRGLTAPAPHGAACLLSACGRCSLCPRGCPCACRVQGLSSPLCCPPSTRTGAPGTAGCSGDSRTELQSRPRLGLVYDNGHVLVRQSNGAEIPVPDVGAQGHRGTASSSLCTCTSHSHAQTRRARGLAISTCWFSHKHLSLLLVQLTSRTTAMFPSVWAFPEQVWSQAAQPPGPPQKPSCWFWGLKPMTTLEPCLRPGCASHKQCSMGRAGHRCRLPFPGGTATLRAVGPPSSSLQLAGARG